MKNKENDRKVWVLSRIKTCIRAWWDLRCISKWRRKNGRIKRAKAINEVDEKD